MTQTPVEIFTDNSDAARFELEVGEHLAHARYRREPGKLVVLYVEADPALRGGGAAARLMAKVAAVAEAEERKIVPVCGYAAIWLKRNKPDVVA